MFSIIIVNWNGEKYLDKCLISIKKQVYNRYKIYIVDNGSTDTSNDIIRKYAKVMDIQLIKLDKNYGFAYANNVGIEASLKDDNEFVLTLNNDLEMSNDCLSNLNEYITLNPKYDVFQILLMNYYERNLVDAMGIYFKEDLQVVQLAYKETFENIKKYRTKVMGACAGAAAYSKAALKDVKDKNGYFDEVFFAYYEDADLAIRLMRKGYKTALVENSVAFHVHSGTGIQDSPFKTYYLTRNLLLLQYKNRDLSGYYRRKNRYYLYFLKKSLVFLVSAKFSNTKATLKGLSDFFKLKSNYDVNNDKKTVEGGRS